MRGQRGGDLLARRRQDVALAVVGPGVGFPGQAEEPVGLAGHGGDHHRHLVAGGARTRDARRDVADAVEVGDRGAAELLYDERHDSPSRGARRRPYRPTGPRRVDRLPPARVPGWPAGGSRSNHSTAARPPRRRAPAASIAAGGYRLKAALRRVPRAPRAATPRGVVRAPRSRMRRAVAVVAAQGRHEELVAGCGTQAVEPLDARYAGAEQLLAQEVDVEERRPRGGRGRRGARAAVRPGTRWRSRRWGCAPPPGSAPRPAASAAHQARLARTQVAHQAEELPAPRRAAEAGAEALGLLRGGGEHARTARRPSCVERVPLQTCDRGRQLVRKVAGQQADLATPCRDGVGRRARARTRPGARPPRRSSPCARRPPTMPASTSPMPPLAMPGLPVGTIATRPSGSAITVRAPFSTVTTPCSRREPPRRRDAIGLHLAGRDAEPAWPSRPGAASRPWRRDARAAGRCPRRR